VKKISLEELHEKYKFLKKMDKDDIDRLIKFILIAILEEGQSKIGDFIKDCTTII
jgi:hypothetical protein